MSMQPAASCAARVTACSHDEPCATEPQLEVMRRQRDDEHRNVSERRRLERVALNMHVMRARGWPSNGPGPCHGLLPVSPGRLVRRQGRARSTQMSPVHFSNAQPFHEHSCIAQALFRCIG